MAAGALSGCGSYLPEEDLMEISIPEFQRRVSQVRMNQLLWKVVDRFEEKYPRMRVEPASGGGGGYQELMIRVIRPGHRVLPAEKAGAGHCCLRAGLRGRAGICRGAEQSGAGLPPGQALRQCGGDLSEGVGTASRPPTGEREPAPGS